MVLAAEGRPLVLEERPDPEPGMGENPSAGRSLRRCRTDLHIVDGELPNIRLPVVPGHEIVGIVEALGPGVASHRIGQRVGVPWLGHTCGVCPIVRHNVRISVTGQCSPDMVAMVDSPPIPWPTQPMPLRSMGSTIRS